MGRSGTSALGKPGTSDLGEAWNRSLWESLELSRTMDALARLEYEPFCNSLDAISIECETLETLANVLFA